MNVWHERRQRAANDKARILDLLVGSSGLTAAEVAERLSLSRARASQLLTDLYWYSRLVRRGTPWRYSLRRLS